MDAIPVEWKYEGSFLKMGIKKYVLPSQQQLRDYEIIERANKSGHDVDKADGVNILAILYSKINNTKEILLEKNYRPPIANYCIEYPGGLIDEGETKEQAAVRELMEETGFSGEVLEGFGSPLLPVCSGTGSESTHLIPVLVDLDREENAPGHVQQHLEEDEIITTFRTPLADFEKTVRDLHAEGYAIELLVYYTALGMALKSRFAKMIPETQVASEGLQ